MKLAYSLLAALSLTWSASGAIVTYNDFRYYGNSPDPNTKGSAFGNEDVFGFLKSFDIEKATIETTASTVKIDLWFNYGQNGGDTGLGDYVSSSFPTVFPGDVLMFIDSTWYAIPLISHDAFTRNASGPLIVNNLYVTGDPLSAQQVTGQENPSTRYNPTAAVWADPATSTATGVVAQRTIEGPFGTSEIHVSLLLNDVNFATLVNNNLSTFVFNFASATCGNDVLIGIGQFDEPVPEPVTMALIGTGLLGLAWLRRRG